VSRHAIHVTCGSTDAGPARDGAYMSLAKRIRFEEHLTECERRRRFGVVTAILLTHGETLR
jgi:hypothetical protein